MNVYVNLKPNNHDGESDLLTIEVPASWHSPRGGGAPSRRLRRTNPIRTGPRLKMLKPL